MIIPNGDCGSTAQNMRCVSNFSIIVVASFPFPLLAVDGHTVCDQYEVWGPKKFMGHAYEGVLPDIS